MMSTSRRLSRVPSWLFISSNVNFFRAAVRDIFRPAPCEADMKDSGFPNPDTMKLLIPMDPGITPNCPLRAEMAPFRVTITSLS